MGGFSVEKVKELFNIPEDFAPMTMIAAGYLGQPESLPGKLKERELQDRKRQELTAMVFAGEFGKAADWF
jgi:hypothetical protein